MNSLDKIQNTIPQSIAHIGEADERWGQDREYHDLLKFETPLYSQASLNKHSWSYQSEVIENSNLRSKLHQVWAVNSHMDIERYAHFWTVAGERETRVVMYLKELFMNGALNQLKNAINLLGTMRDDMLRNQEVIKISTGYGVLSQAFEYIEAQEYKKAKDKFEMILVDWPDHPLVKKTLEIMNKYLKFLEKYPLKKW